MISKAVTILNPEPEEPQKEEEKEIVEKPKPTIYKRKEYGNCGT